MIPPDAVRPEWATRQLQPAEFTIRPTHAAKSLVHAALSRWLRRRESRGVNDDTLGGNLITAANAYKPD